MGCGGIRVEDPVAKSVTADVVQSARQIFAVMTSEQRFGLATYCTSQLTKTQLNAFAHWFNDILTRGWKRRLNATPVSRLLIHRHVISGPQACLGFPLIRRVERRRF